MKLPIMLAMCSALIGVVALSSTAIAQQKKTKAECTKEWQANKAENQANKITEKAYVDKCIATAATPAAATAPAAPAKLGRVWYRLQLDNYTQSIEVSTSVERE